MLGISFRAKRDAQAQRPPSASSRSSSWLSSAASMRCRRARRYNDYEA